MKSQILREKRTKEKSRSRAIFLLLFAIMEPFPQMFSRDENCAELVTHKFTQKCNNGDFCSSVYEIVISAEFFGKAFNHLNVGFYWTSSLHSLIPD